VSLETETENRYTHFGFKKIPFVEKKSRVGQVFSSVAQRYNLMNDLMSLGIHRIWKRAAVAQCQLQPGQQVLDLAGGTGDITRLMHPKLQGQGRIVLADINAAMLDEGQRILTDKGIVSLIDWVQADAEALPFPDNHFDTAICAFGLRNVTDKDKALENLYRVLRSGGRLVILEFSHLSNPSLQAWYDSYSFHVLPFWGRLVCNDADSYQYLAESIRKHPIQEVLLSMMQRAGFVCCDYQNWNGGIVAIHKGFK
jgi:demethylmenaquinone methyltransferase/2-methoxy-6-polyprenyl-1,4-benzoquinol methylase